jgi:CheY-like chemotaxis protein
MLQQSDHSVAGTILVADDSAANRDLLEELLTAQGFRPLKNCPELRSF